MLLTMTAFIPDNSSSAVGSPFVPYLFFNLCTRTPFNVPSGFLILATNRDKPLLPYVPCFKKKEITNNILLTGRTVPSLGFTSRAKRTVMSAVVALENHLNPEIDQMFVDGSWSSAIVSVLPTSLPPGRSVIHWPLVQNTLGSRLNRMCPLENGLFILKKQNTWSIEYKCLLSFLLSQVTQWHEQRRLEKR